METEQLHRKVKRTNAALRWNTDTVAAFSSKSTLSCSPLFSRYPISLHGSSHRRWRTMILVKTKKSNCCIPHFWSHWCRAGKKGEEEADEPYDPISHGGSRFPLVGPVLWFTLEQDPVFLHGAQTPTGALRPVCCPATLKGKKKKEIALTTWFIGHTLIHRRLVFPGRGQSRAELCREADEEGN